MLNYPVTLEEWVTNTRTQYSSGHKVQMITPIRSSDGIRCYLGRARVFSFFFLLHRICGLRKKILFNSDILKKIEILNGIIDERRL